MDSGRHDPTSDTYGPDAADTSVESLTRFEAPEKDAPDGLGLGQVLALYGCGVLVLGVVMLVVSPVFAFVVLLNLIYPLSGLSTTLTVIGAGIVGIGAVIALLWAQLQREAGANVGQGTMRGGAAIGLACLGIIVWALVHPVSSGSHQSPLGQFRRAHRVMTGLSPIALASDGNGNLHVLDHGVHDRIVRVSPSGRVLSGISVDNVIAHDNIGGFAIGPQGDVYVVQYGVPSEIARLSASGKRRSSWQASSDGSFEGSFGGPLAVDSALAIDPRGGIYLAGTLTYYHGATDSATVPLVREYTPGGHLLRTWQGRVKNATDLGMAIDRSGNVYLGDQAGSRLQSFTPSGRLRWAWTSSRHDPDLASSEPPGVALDRAGNVYMAGGATLIVEKFSATGHWLSAWPVPGGTTKFGPLNGLAVDRQGSVYVEIAGSMIYKYSSSGKPLAVWK